jgi:lipopolysaccharide transport system ATP-binding protein
VGAVNDRSTKADSDYVWALQDINFEVQQGEVLGIIGKNGAGKSTLLKILSRVTSPTTGEIKTKGRIASLLEVGTGFHPELTGRENIYLNGAILGMTKVEIKAKEDEIINFSGCERYVDTPVKRYSSGMRVRLAFAVAAFLEPDILVIDEVLAVGDAEFQKKAIGKMQDISKADGRTVLFVSHNMAAVKSLCTGVMVLEHGKVVFNGETNEGIQFYLRSSTNSLSANFESLTGRKGNGKVQLINAKIYGSSEEVLPQTGQPFTMKFQIKNNEEIKRKDIRFDLRIDDGFGQRMIWMSDSLFEIMDNSICTSITFKNPKLNLNQGIYYVTIHITINGEVADWIQNAFNFTVAEGDFYGSGKKVPTNQSNVLVEYYVQ